MPNKARYSAHLKRDLKIFLRIEKHIYALCDVILGIGNISFDNSTQWMNKMWI